MPHPWLYLVIYIFDIGLRSMSRNVFNKKQLLKKVPILGWLPKYNVQTGVSDLIAGITVGLTIIPQGIAYALVANLPPQVLNLYFLIKIRTDQRRQSTSIVFDLIPSVESLESISHFLAVYNFQNLN